MKNIRFLLPALILGLLWSISGCQTAELTDAEFASVVMRAVVDRGYVDNSKAIIYDQNGLTIDLIAGDFDLSDGQASAQFSVGFAAFELERSTVDGDVAAAVTIIGVGGQPQTLTAVFNTGPGNQLVVIGKHGGQYQFDNATVVYDFATHTYTFSGEVIVDGVVHTL